MISHPKPAPAQAWRTRSRRRRQQLNTLLDRLWVLHDPRAITLLDPRQHQPGSFSPRAQLGCRVVHDLGVSALVTRLSGPRSPNGPPGGGARQMTHPFTLA
jgi:hypothetical protein